MKAGVPGVEDANRHGNHARNANSAGNHPPMLVSGTLFLNRQRPVNLLDFRIQPRLDCADIQTPQDLIHIKWASVEHS